MKIVKITLIGLSILLASLLHAQEANNIQVEGLKTKILNELKNEKLLYSFKEKVKSKTNDTLYWSSRFYVNKSYYFGVVDDIFFSHDTLCLKVNRYTQKIEVNGTPKGSKFEAITIFVPIGELYVPIGGIYISGESYNNIALKNVQIIYNQVNFGETPEKIEERISHAKKLFILLNAYNAIVHAQRYEQTFEKFKTEVNSHKGQAEKPTIPEEQRKLIVQANAANDEKRYEDALSLYRKAVMINQVSFPQAYFNMALLAASTYKFNYAIFNMKKYMLLVPEAEDARAAQDKIYEWEAEIEK